MRLLFRPISRHIRATTALSVLLAAVAWSPAALSFERTETCDSYGTYECEPGEEPKPIAWPVRCVKYAVNENGSRDFPAQNTSSLSPELEQLVDQSFQVWNNVSCSDFKMVDGGPTPVSKAAYQQEQGLEGNLNVVVWRDGDWPYRSESAFALTSVTFNSKSGEIADADIEINSDIYEFADLEQSEIGLEDARVDLRNTLTHEVGHFLGLDHPPVTQATMYGRAPIGEVKKRTLHQDDINGICAIYPAPQDGTAATCDSPEDFVPPDPPGGGGNGKGGICNDGCSVSDGPPAPWLALLLLLGWRRFSRRRNDREKTR